MNGYKKRTENKKKDIIKAAQDLFSMHGISAVSVTEIAKKANVSRVTLFKYFGNKETLARVAMSSLIEYLIDEYRTILSSNEAFPQKLVLLLNTRLVGREKIGEQFINSTAWEDPEMIAIVEQLTKTNALPIALEFIDKGKETGYIDDTLDSDAILAYFSAFGPVMKNPDFIGKDKNFHVSLYNLFMGGLIKNWYVIRNDL